jgi:hypothetical protein
MALLPVEDDLAGLVLVRFDEHARGAHEVRVAHGQDGRHGLRVDEGDEAEHAPLLVRDAHVLHRPVLAACGAIINQPNDTVKKSISFVHSPASPTKRTIDDERNATMRVLCYLK